MSATVLQFPERGPFDVVLQRDDQAWLVTVRNGRHGWLYGDRHSAMRSAAWLARNYGTRVREVRQ
jgi:hypothetical protein